MTTRGYLALTLVLFVGWSTGAVLGAGRESRRIDTARLERLAAEPLPGETGLEVAGGAVAVLRGDSGTYDKRYVLLAATGEGAATALATAEALADLELGRDVIVALWSEDEPADTVLPLVEIAAHLELSRAGRPAENRVTVAAAGSSPVWSRLLEQANVPVGFDLEVDDAPDLSQARAASLFAAGVPGLQLATYVADAAEREDDDLRVARLAALLTARLSRLEEAPSFVSATAGTETSPAVSRIFTGTIPDYAADVEGLRLEGVVEGGPAATAGLQAGDVIVELGGRTIADVYAYAEALDGLVVDRPTSVVYLRDGERRETTIIPRAR